MEKMESLRAGVAEMRSVARRLNQWADDLEASFRNQGEEPTTASGGNIVGSELSRNERVVRGTVATIETAAPAEAEVPAAEPVQAAGRKKNQSGKRTVSTAEAEPAAAEEKKTPLTLPEVRAILAEKCAKGFSTQVKALIESYGVSSLKEVPAEHYEALVEAVKVLGDADAG